MLAFLALLLLLPASSPGAGTGAQSASRLEGTVTHVADGDTLDVRVGNRTLTVRLEGIDAPEGGQQYGAEARRLLRVLVFSQRVAVLVSETDQYGRLVARVRAGGTDVSEEMVRNGLAWHFTRYSSDARLARLEAEARRQRAGLWADAGAVPPWTWRSRSRPGAASPRTTQPPSPPTGGASPRTTQPRSPRPGTATVAGPYHGNVSSLVYHAPGCRDYDCKNCTRVFASRKEAESAGFRPHRQCVLDRR